MSTPSERLTVSEWIRSLEASERRQRIQAAVTNAPQLPDEILQSLWEHFEADGARLGFDYAVFRGFVWGIERRTQMVVAEALVEYFEEAEGGQPGAVRSTEKAEGSDE